MVVTEQGMVYELSFSCSTNQINPLLDVTDLKERLNGMTDAKVVVGVDFDDVVGQGQRVALVSVPLDRGVVQVIQGDPDFKT